MTEKYGFVYIWYDSKHKRYYIGMHWGSEDDGYICSSTWMRQAYKHRPHHFKRKILERVYTNRKDLYECEKKWLSLIKDEELKVKYYNLSKNINDTWLNEDNILSRKQKISKKTKEAMYRPEVREKYLSGLKTRDNRSSDSIVREKRRETMLVNGRNKGKITVTDSSGAVFHVTKEDPRWISGDVWHINKGRKREPISEEHKQKIKDLGVFRKLNNTKVTCVYCGAIGNVGNIARYHNEKCNKKLIASYA